jgi:hypothetical protein
MSFDPRSTPFQYPPTLRRAVTALWVSLLLATLVEYILAWLRTFYSVLAAPLDWPRLVLLTPSQDILPMLLSAHIGFAFALIAADALAFAVPRITLTNNRLAMQTALGARVVSLDALRALHSVELPGGRFIVWVESANGMPLQRFAASLIFGRWMGRGFFLTSDLIGFDHLVAALVAQLKRKYGEADFAAHLDEDKPTRLLSMLTAPLATLRELSSAPTIPISAREAALQMVSIAASLALPQVIAAIIRVEMPWGALLVFLFAFVEFPLASLYLTAVPVEYMRALEFNDVLRLYPLTQLPRWLVAAAMTLLVIAGAPLIVFVFAAAPAVVLGCYGVLKLTEDWFAVRQPDALLGLVVTVIVQSVLYVFFIAMLR